MAGELKQEFIEAVRLVPDGIKDFLETPIPAPPVASVPGDVDSAIIANGVCAYYLLELFRPFEGLTPIELLLRIGQHNSVLESAMLAGLEYIEGSDESENSLTIVEPQPGGTYLPGEVRFQVEVSNGVCTGMSLNLGGDDIAMKNQDGTWTQYVDILVSGSITAAITATFEDGSTQSASVTFTISEGDPELPPGEQPKPPGGTDLEALTRAKEQVMSTYQALLIEVRHTTVSTKETISQAKAAFSNAVQVFLAAYTKTSSFITDIRNRITGQLSVMDTAFDPGSGDIVIDVFEKALAVIINNINMLYTMASEG